MLNTALFFTDWTQPPALSVAFSCLYLLVAALAVLALFDFLLFDRIFARKGVDVPVFFRWILRWGLFGCFLALILRLTYGIDLLQIVAPLAAIALGLGFALQPAIANLFSGMSIHLERVCRVGDWVTIGDIEGEVVEMSLRAAHIKTWENRMMIVPNNRFFNEVFVNHTLPSRVDGRTLDIGAHYQHPPHQVIQALIETARDVPGVLHRPAPIALVKTYSDHAVVYRVRYFLNDFKRRYEIDGEVMRRVWYRFRRDGIQIPFPTRTFINETPTTDDVRKAAESETVARIEALRRCAIFAGQSERTLRRISEGLEAVHFTDGEAVVHEGANDRAFYLLRGGKCATFKHAEGKEVAFAEIHPGDFFGEYALLTGEPRRATVRAIGDAVLYRLGERTMREVLHGNPGAAEVLSRAISERIPPEFVSSKEEDGTTPSLGDRFFGRLRGLFGNAGSEGAD